MAESKSNSIGRGLIYEGHLPLVWNEIPALPADTELSGLEYANLEVLRTIFALETHTGEPHDDTAETASSELARLDFKVNLLLDLVGQVLARQLAIPKARQLTLMPDKILWRDSVAPAPDRLVRIELYLTPKYPRPLTLHGQVREVRSLPEGQTILAEFLSPGDALQEGLERFIFVHHRRAIAYNRRRGKRTSA